MPSTSNLVPHPTTALVVSAPVGIPENIKRLRAEKHWSQPALAKNAGVSQQLISQLENGKNLTTKYLPQIAKALGVTIGEIDPAFAETRSTVGVAFAVDDQVKFAGVVQAGLFRPVDEYFNQDEEWERPVGLVRHPAYPRVRQYAWQAKGDSMSEAGILDGMWLVGADAADYVDQYGDIETGDLVIVERTRFQGAERELTVKEIRYYRNRYELHPRSSNPAHKPIIVPNDLTRSGDEEEVKVIGVVLTAFVDVHRRKRNTRKP